MWVYAEIKMFVRSAIDRLYVHASQRVRLSAGSPFLLVQLVRFYMKRYMYTFFRVCLFTCKCTLYISHKLILPVVGLFVRTFLDKVSYCFQALL
jgi:hypothetical protein